MELIVTTFQTLNKGTPKENCSKPHNEKWKDDGKGKSNNKKKEEEEEAKGDSSN